MERALELVDAAHRSAKEAITELRDLARGIHPPVLDHGLGTALTTLAARSDVPVELVIDLPERPSAAIETIAYFCAAELLTNVVKHSGARHATLEVVHVPGLLRVRGQRRWLRRRPDRGPRRPGRARRAGQDRGRQAAGQQPAPAAPPWSPSSCRRTPDQPDDCLTGTGATDADCDRRGLGSSPGGPGRDPGRPRPRGGRRRRQRRGPAGRGGPSTSPTSPWWTCGCRPATPTRACAPRSPSAVTTPRPGCWSSPSTSRPGTPPTCSARRPAAVPQASGTCSRTGSPMSVSSSKR